MKRLFDTNVALYLLGGRLREALPSGDYFVSVITEIELLSYPSIDSEEEMCRHQPLKIPDAIIAATALILEAELLSNDKKLQRVPQLQLREVAVRGQ